MLQTFVSLYEEPGPKLPLSEVILLNVHLNVCLFSGFHRSEAADDSA